MKYIKDLFFHMHWADAQVWDAVLTSDHIADDARIIDLFYHVHSVQRAFMAVWTNNPIAMPKREHFVSLQQLADWGRTYHMEMMELWPSFDTTRLEEVMSVPWSRFMEQRMGRKPDTVTMEETMLQVLQHSTYHRGQINARLREIGAEPPLTDYITWLWLGRPAPEWK
ncbi:MAG: DinB family protein [Bacteroidota bacterium]|jgi:uncharacterized damage-inducible protein DinB|nr:DinB family protein [Bacteroidota bacterium]